MTYNNYITKRRTFKHLNYEQRKIIEKLLEEKTSKKEIARLLGISRSTLYSEIKRGSVEQLNTDLTTYTKYFADCGQRVYEKNRKNSRKPYKLVKAADFIEYAEEQILTNKMTPDVICGREKLMNNFPETVCTKTLYNYIDLGLIKVKNIDLPLRVKLNKKPRLNRKNRRILGESIENRPQNINDRTEFGHWEIDTVVGKRNKGSVLLTMDERMTRKRIIVKIHRKDSSSVAKGISKIMNSFGDNAQKYLKALQAITEANFPNLQKRFRL